MTYLRPEEVIEKKKAYLCPPSWGQFYKKPPHMVKGEMQYLIDESGKRYVDFFAGVSVMNCGHCNPEILSKTIEQMQTLQHTSIVYLTEQMPLLAEKLSKVLPGDLKRSFFCCTGSEANETALTMAKMYTGKNEIIALSSGLHGRTFMTMSATAIPMWRIDPNLAETVHFVPHPWDERLSLSAAAERSLAAIEAVIKERGSDKIAALIIEPIQGNGGIIMPEVSYFKRLKALLEANNILMIVDEVQTGFARTGKMFAIEHFDVVPDIMTVAKALGNGMPISAACTNDKIAMAFNKPSASTLGGNPVCAATGMAVLDYMEKYDLVERAKVLGGKLKDGLLALKAQYDFISDVRGIGLMLGMELRDPCGKALADEVDLVLEGMLERGFIIGKNGLERNVLALQPPLVIDEENVSSMLSVLGEVLKEVAKSLL